MTVVLQIAIALVLIYMLMGLIASSVQEVGASFLNLRGKMLRKTLSQMLSSVGAGESLFEKIYGHPLIGGSPVTKNPSYVSATHFTMALVDALADGEAVSDIKLLEQKVETLPDGPLQKTLKTFLNHAAGDVQTFVTEAGDWYDDVMRRASDIYKIKSHIITFLIGLVLAVSLNVDTVRVAQTLMVNESLRSQIADAAVSLQQSNPATSDVNENIRKASDKLFSLGLPIGWQDNGTVARRRANVGTPVSLHEYFSSRGWQGSVLVVIGWLLTAIASAFGAPFWYSILARLLPLRGGSQKKTSDGKSDA